MGITQFKIELHAARALAERAGLKLELSVGRDGGRVFLLRDDTGRIQFKRTQTPDLFELLEALVLPLDLREPEAKAAPVDLLAMINELRQRVEQLESDAKYAAESAKNDLYRG